MSAADKELVEWQLKYLNERAGEMSESDLEWTIRMEKAFKEFGSLTPKQRTTLEDIYKRY